MAQDQDVPSEAVSELVQDVAAELGSSPSLLVQGGITRRPVLATHLLPLQATHLMLVGLRPGTSRSISSFSPSDVH